MGSTASSPTPASSATRRRCACRVCRRTPTARSADACASRSSPGQSVLLTGACGRRQRARPQPRRDARPRRIAQAAAPGRGPSRAFRRSRDRRTPIDVFPSSGRQHGFLPSGEKKATDDAFRHNKRLPPRSQKNQGDASPRGCARRVPPETLERRARRDPLDACAIDARAPSGARPSADVYEYLVIDVADVALGASDAHFDRLKGHRAAAGLPFVDLLAGRSRRHGRRSASWPSSPRSRADARDGAGGQAHRRHRRSHEEDRAGPAPVPHGRR